VRVTITNAIEQKMALLKAKELEAKLARETIDITLPGKEGSVGARNPFYVIEEEMIEIFLGMGFEIADGPEVESDHYNFELMNIPKDHPSRDMQDTFYIDDNNLLRTHTSPVQARVMQAKKEGPIRVICPGKTYRRDDDDATHSHQFAQIEGLVVDKDINIGHLKATLELFVKKMFGEKREIRLRSSYFPFTEPSVEVDITCANCGGKGCSMCKGTGYIEILGAGMVHPNVLKMSGYDPEVYSGFAFGVGIERVAILRYGIDDIRKFYQNDVRFIRQFKKAS
jgi:phenylalanyl-tRNA synthetase alpha chain